MSRSKTINSIITTQNIDYKNTFTSREKTICELIGKKCYDAGFNEGATREHISCMKRYAKGLKHTSESCNFKYDENCIACNWEADLNKAINALHPAKDEKVKE